MKPKLLTTWRDKNYQATTSVYTYANGMRLVVTHNPASVNFDYSVLLRGGAFYESQQDVPNGTAHFLEHMLFKPNAKFKTIEKLEANLFGSKTRPALYNNARTGIYKIYFYGHTHQRGAKRILEHLYHQLLYPTKRFQEFIESERKIILSEEAQKPPLAQDQDYQIARFFLGDTVPDEVKRVIGNSQSIKEITIDHLKKWYDLLIQPENMILAVQTGKKLTPEVWRQLNHIANALPAAKITEHPTISQPALRKLENQLKIGYFHEPKFQDVGVSFFFLNAPASNYNYHDTGIRYLTRTLIEKVGFDQIREDQNLVYYFSQINSWICIYWKGEGFRTRCSLEKLPKVLNECHKLLHEYVPKFIKSKQGKLWLNSQVSKYIFPSTTSYDNDYAENIAMRILDGFEFQYDDKQAAAAIKKITVDDLLAYYQTHVLETPPHIWTVSSSGQEAVEAAVKESDIYKYYAGLTSATVSE